MIRHPYAGAAQMVAGWTAAAVVNAGDGKHEHPSQALLDVYTLRRRLGSLEGKRIWIVGDVLHSRVARSNLIAFQRMGAEVTVCGPPTLIPRGIEELGCEVSHCLDGLGEAEVVYALRMQQERMSESFVPSLREYAATFQIDTRRLNPRQLLMHPGPVNRGVELSGEAIDSPQSLIAEQVAAGLVVRMAILYELLAGGERPTPVGDGRRRSQPDPDRDSRHEPRPTPSTSAPARPRTWSCAGRPCSTRSPASTASTTSSSATARSPSSPRRARRDADGAEVVEAEGLHAFPAFFDPHVHLRTPGHEHKEDVETGTRAAAAGGYCGILAMANTEPPVSTAADISALREQARAGASVPVGFLATVTKGDEGRGADRDGRTARSRRGRLLRRRPADRQRPGDAPRAPVPAPLRRQRSPCTRRTPSSPATASCTRARSRPRSGSPASPRSRSRR